jgi:hypothetical protein
MKAGKGEEDTAEESDFGARRGKAKFTAKIAEILNLMRPEKMREYFGFVG